MTLSNLDREFAISMLDAVEDYHFAQVFLMETGNKSRLFTLLQDYILAVNRWDWNIKSFEKWLEFKPNEPIQPYL